MKLPRFYFTEALIVLPFLVILASTIFLFVRELPRVDAREAERITRAYREVALDVRDGEIPDIHEVSPEGARTQGRLGKKGTWGYEALPKERVRVWYRPPHAPMRRAVEIDAVKPANDRAFYRNVAAVTLVLTLILTNIGLRRYRRFLAAREDFIAATAHDLRTPLAALGFTIGQDDEQAQLIVRRMNYLVKNLTDFLRLGGHRPKPRQTAMDLRATFDEAYAVLRRDFQAQLRGEELKVEGPERVLVRADEMMCQQICWNLLTNALKYALPYGDFSVRFEEEQGEVRVCFADTGKGLAAREKRLVFKRYFRAKGARESGKGGFGIGLATAREFARAMGGDIIVKDNSPKGTVFIWSVPRNMV